MAWISVHEQLKDHRKVRELARVLRCSRHEALGILVALWLWGINNADREGSLGRASAEDIADGVMYRARSAAKLVDGLAESGWIEKAGEDGYRLHDWDYWQQSWYKAMEKREANTQRMRDVRWREGQAAVDCASHSVSHSAAHSAVNGAAHGVGCVQPHVHASPSPIPSPKPSPIPLPIHSHIPPADGWVSSPEETCERAVPCEEIAAMYHSICRSLPPWKKITKSRRKKLSTRWGEHPDMKEWREAFVKIKASGFCKGKGPHNWVATFDWLIQNDRNILKVLEGNYDDGRAPSGTLDGEVILK